MISFVLSQVLGLVIFACFNLGLYLYLAYKRHQFYRQTGRPSWLFHLASMVVVIFFLVGLSHRVFYIWTELDGQLNQRTRTAPAFHSRRI